jgi:hypothetical protein
VLAGAGSFDAWLPPTDGAFDGGLDCVNEGFGKEGGTVVGERIGACKGDFVGFGI